MGLVAPFLGGWSIEDRTLGDGAYHLESVQMGKMIQYKADNKRAQEAKLEEFPNFCFSGRSSGVEVDVTLWKLHARFEPRTTATVPPQLMMWLRSE